MGKTQQQIKLLYRQLRKQGLQKDEAYIVIKCKYPHLCEKTIEDYTKRGKIKV